MVGAMETDRRKFIIGVAAVLGASSLPAAQPSAAAIIGHAQEGCPFPIGAVIPTFDRSNPPGFVPLDGRTLRADEFPSLAAVMGLDDGGGIRLMDMRDRVQLPDWVTPPRWVMRVA